MVAGVFSRGSRTQHPPDRAGSTAGARDGRPTLRRRQGPAGRPQRLRRAALPEGLRGVQTRSPTCCRPSSSRPPASTPAARGTTSSGPVKVELSVDETQKAGRFEVLATLRQAAEEGAPGGAVAGAAVGPAGLPRRRPVTVGRLSECTIPLNDNNVSRRHAEIRPNRQNFVVVDLGSTNGTMVNGTASTARRRSATGTSSVSARRTYDSRLPDPRGSRCEPAAPPPTHLIDHAHRTRSRHPQAGPAGGALPLLRPRAVGRLVGGAHRPPGRRQPRVNERAPTCRPRCRRLRKAPKGSGARSGGS